MTVALAELRAWNDGIRRARDAYHTDPFALARLLATTHADTCRHCRDRAHTRCTGRMGHSGRLPCLCEHISHYERTSA